MNLLDTFLKNSTDVENENFILNQEQTREFIEKNSTTESFLHLPSLEIEKSDIKIDKEGIESAFIECNFAIADTGSVVLESTEEKIRLASSLSEHFYAVVYKSNLKKSILELDEFMQTQMSSINSYIAFITGASRTADIERVLTIGVHGPVKMSVIIIDEELK